MYPSALTNHFDDPIRCRGLVGSTRMSDSERLFTSIGPAAGYPGLLPTWVAYGAAAPVSSPVVAPGQADIPLYPSTGPLLVKYGTSGR